MKTEFLHSPLPVTSKSRFLNELITFPSFLLSKGLLLLSVTFCFNLERTFKLGSEAGNEKNKTNVFKTNYCFAQISLAFPTGPHLIQVGLRSSDFTAHHHHSFCFSSYNSIVDYRLGMRGRALKSFECQYCYYFQLHLHFTFLQFSSKVKTSKWTCINENDPVPHLS